MPTELIFENFRFVLAVWSSVAGSNFQKESGSFSFDVRSILREPSHSVMNLGDFLATETTVIFWNLRNTLQRIATHCNALQHTASTATHCNILQPTAHNASQCDTVQHSATQCNTLQQCDTVQHTATQCNTVQRLKRQQLRYIKANLVGHRSL